MQLRYYQQEASDATISFLQTEQGNGLLGLPTGTGKSVILADIIKRLPTQRILKLVHTQKIISQNAERLLSHYPECDLGICSSGLNRYDVNNKVIFGGIATVKNRIAKIGHVDLLIVDEVHLFGNNEKSMYFKAYSRLKEINPNIRLVGLSATNFRTGYGLLLDNKLFHKMIYDICNWQSYNRLVSEGYLANIITFSPKSQIDTKGISIQNGDFNQKELQEAVLKNDITTKCLKEAISRSEGRIKWMAFCVGIEHVIEVEKTLNALGVSSIGVHSKMNDKEIESAFNGFKDDTYKCIVSNNMIIAGFDEPRIDFIIFLRPTKSSGLYVQAIGRGCRPHPQKKDLFVMDFANNALTCGCVNDPVIPKAKGKGKGEAPVKLCPACNCFNHLSARICFFCGVEFVIQKHITKNASVERLLRTVDSDPKYAKCLRVSYDLRIKEGSNYLLITYHCEGIKLTDFFMPEKKEWWAKDKARKWWASRMPNVPVPNKAQGAFDKKDLIPVPNRIKWHYGKKYPDIISFEYFFNGKQVIIEKNPPTKKQIIKKRIEATLLQSQLFKEN